MDTIKDLLTQIGLNEKEALVYLKMLELGDAPAKSIIKATGLKKGNTYDILYNLEDKGLVSKHLSNKVMIFRPAPPAQLLKLAEQQQEHIDNARRILEKKLSKLNQKYEYSVGRPIVSHFEGEDGLLEVFKDVYAKKDGPVYGCGDIDIIEATFPKHAAEKLIPLRKKNNLKAISIFTKSPLSEEYKKHDKEQNRESLLVDKKKYPLPAEIDVYEDKIAMMSFAKGKFTSIIVQNEDFATSLRSIFKLAMKNNDS